MTREDLTAQDITQQRVASANGKLALALVGVLAMALMGCVGWIVRPQADYLGRREWDQYVLKGDDERLSLKEDLVEIRDELRTIRADVSTLMRNSQP